MTPDELSPCRYWIVCQRESLPGERRFELRDPDGHACGTLEETPSGWSLSFDALEREQVNRIFRTLNLPKAAADAALSRALAEAAGFDPFADGEPYAGADK